MAEGYPIAWVYYILFIHLAKSFSSVCVYTFKMKRSGQTMASFQTLFLDLLLAWLCHVAYSSVYTQFQVSRPQKLTCQIPKHVVLNSICWNPPQIFKIGLEILSNLSIVCQRSKMECYLLFSNFCLQHYSNQGNYDGLGSCIGDWIFWSAIKRGKKKKKAMAFCMSQGTIQGLILRFFTTHRKKNFFFHLSL